MIVVIVLNPVRRVQGEPEAFVAAAGPARPRLPVDPRLQFNRKAAGLWPRSALVTASITNGSRSPLAGWLHGEELGTRLPSLKVQRGTTVACCRSPGWFRTVHRPVASRDHSPEPSSSGCSTDHPSRQLLGSSKGLEKWPQFPVELVGFIVRVGVGNDPAAGMGPQSIALAHQGTDQNVAVESPSQSILIKDPQ